MLEQKVVNYQKISQAEEIEDYSNLQNSGIYFENYIFAKVA